MRITVIGVCKIKEKYLAQGMQEYVKRISSYAKLEVIELKDSPLPDKLHQEEINRVISSEEGRIKQRLSKAGYVVALDPKGKEFDSVGFANHIHNLTIRGTSDFIFVIGGTLGLSDNFKKEADLLLSFSKFTFPHQLMRLILVEQIYRAFKIIKNEPYHY